MSRSEAVIRVECDDCGKESLEIELAALSAREWNIGEILEKHNWTVSRLGDVGPECSARNAASKERRV